MGKITVFTLDGCPVCKEAVALLSSKCSDVQIISLSQSPDWKQQLFLLTEGRMTVPQVFFNKRYIGGLDKLKQLDSEGKLDGMLKECLESTEPSLELKIPKGSEFVEVIPKELRDKWQTEIEIELGPQLGGTPARPITGIMMILDTPGPDMAVLCCTGEARTHFPPGMSGPKGTDSGEDKFYCQVTIDRAETMFINGPATFPQGLKENYDHVKFGYSWYIGAPWQVRDIKGTVVALEKEEGILKPEHQPTMEAFRDKVQKELKQYLDNSKESNLCLESGCKMP